MAISETMDACRNFQKLLCVMRIPLPTMFGKIAQIFGSKEKTMPALDFSLLGVDVHSHFIPGIDDGADTLETSIALLREMQALGFKKVITTPHVMSDFYKNTSENITRLCGELNEEVSRQGVDLIVECAAEYYCDTELKELVKKKDLLTFGKNYVLFELPFISAPPNMAEIIFEMQLAGYKPVLAHPERYTYWHTDFEKYQSMVDRGVLLQLNINSMTGHYSPDVKKVAKKMIDQGMISLVGSDCHHLGHVNLMKQAAKVPEFHSLIESGLLLNSSL